MRGILIVAGLLAVATAATNSNCSDGLYMIVARGTGEPATAGPNGIFPANTGSPGYVAQLISGKIKDSKIIGVEFAASGDSVKDYVKSENAGAAAMLKLANEYHSSCPDSKMALLGYSQGAQVVSDVLCGGAGGVFNHDAPLSPDIVKNNVIAAVLFGDPTHIAHTAYDRGTSAHNGMFPRTNDTVCTKYNDRMASWCDKGDKYCDAGNSTAVHGLYLQKYNATMVSYVVDRWNKSKASSSTATSTGSPTSTNTGTSSPTASTGAASKSTILGWPLVVLGCGLFFV